nr:MAG TPA: antitoxin [Caudoviricetes sp.]
MPNNEEKKKRPQDKWDEKAGLVPKTYKVNKEVAEEFRQACKEAGVAMGTQLTKLMKQFIEEVNNK